MRYAIAAAATVPAQWDYTASMAHKSIVMEVAAKAEAKKRRPWLGIIYDTLARKEWAERSAAKG